MPLSGEAPQRVASTGGGVTEVFRFESSTLTLFQ